MVTKQAKLEDMQDDLLQVRASLGRWKCGDTNAHIFVKELPESPYRDPRKYLVIEESASFKIPLKYHIDLNQVKAKLATFRQLGYTLISPQHPELMEFFRNGHPITVMDILADEIDALATEVDDTRTGLEFLMDYYTDTK